jgi:hypothetical protein
MPPCEQQSRSAAPNQFVSKALANSTFLACEQTENANAFNTMELWQGVGTTERYLHWRKRRRARRQAAAVRQAVAVVAA